MRPILLVAVLWAALYSSLAISRHAAFESNAFDLGYVTQTLWSTVHGQPFRFTTVDGLPVSPEGELDVGRLHQPPSLLAFHVEPLLLLVAPVFALWPDPRLLLVLQAAGLAGGGVAAAALARRRLDDAPATLGFGLAFLLSPSVAAAALSDFHAVALAAALLMAALAFASAGRPRLALGAALLAAAGREDATVLVATLGAYLLVRARLARREGNASTLRWERGTSPPDPLDRGGRLGLVLLVAAGGWAVLAFGLILPFFNGTLGALRRGEPALGSIFWHRYDWLGPTPLAALRHVALDPSVVAGWLAQADVRAFLATLVLTGGVLALLAPGVLLVSLPIVLEDALSSFDWMRSGGAHYSVVVVPILVFAAIEGLRHLPRDGSRRWTRRLGLGVVLVAAVVNHVWLGASPLVPGLRWPAPGPREQAVAAILRTIPDSAIVAATSSVYPHVATRARAYWYPAVNGADYLAIDAASSPAPTSSRDLRQRVTRALTDGTYRLAAAAPGFLLLRRAEVGAPAQPGVASSDLPERFYDFARASADDRARATAIPDVTFGEGLHLDGVRVEETATQTVFGPSALVTTFWHIDRAWPRDLTFVFYPARRSDGAIVGELPDAAPEPVWYPTSRWRPGEVIQMRVVLPRVRDLQAVGVAVVDPATGRRLSIQAGPGRALWENGSIARVARFDGGA